ncbi:hypothetical protein BOTNAR_2625g00010 [Botryotinia narcissicola]|uniref:Uncharacterized protein n=1 Tax=Botryotinia narcissicola TaxID=278944 RepID=A0A4Z1H630_9HELO|nr:hypothetical protein BOTNAR_2625g00010 [Botryotinia narcissicola]
MKNLPGRKRPGVWSLLVQSLIKRRNDANSEITESNNPSLEEVISIRSFASREELINTVKWAVTEDDFKYLMETIGLWDTIISLTLQKSGIIGLLKQEIEDKKRSEQCSPQSPLQWTAFETEYNIEKARDIAIKERNWEKEKDKPKEDKNERTKKAAHLDQISVSHDVRDSMKKDMREAGRKVAQQEKELLGVIEWMEDLTKRICKDKDMETSEWSSLNNLIQKSWQELPKSKVETRLMKPVCLVSLQRHDKDISDTKLKKGSTKRRNKNHEKCDLITPEVKGNTNIKGDQEDDEPLIHQEAEGKLDSKKIPKYDTFERVALYMPYITFGSCHQKDAKTETYIDPPKSRESYNKLLEVYKDKVIHRTRSLDQFYYHSRGHADA